MNINVRERYINILKRSLSFTLWWPEPAVPMEIAASYFSKPIERFIRFVSSCMKPFKISLTYNRGDITEHDREEGRPYFSVYADTMIGMKRLDNINYCFDTVIQDDIKGDMIETGVWRGGACIFMRGLLAAYEVEDRKVYVADSFKGLPKPEGLIYPADIGQKFHENRLMAVSLDQVKRNFERYNLLDDKVIFLEGWFRDTLPNAPIEKLAIMRLDGDMYSSTIEALNVLYPKLSPGGFCIIDDYGALDSCRKAVDEFRKLNNISDKMHSIDWTGIFWRKGV